jgi:thiol-disulfide isomerase/thioredoxin
MSNRYFASITLITILLGGVITSCSPSKNGSETSAEVKTIEPSAAIKPESNNSPVAIKPKPVGALAAELQGKPVVVDIYASWCPACKNVAPTIAKLKTEYAGKANFVVFDVSNTSTTAKSTARAKELGLDKFLAKNLTQTGLVAVINPATAKVLIEERDEPEISTYKKPLDAFIAQAK